MMKNKKRNSLFCSLSDQILVKPMVLMLGALLWSQLSYAEKPPLTDPAFESDVQLDVLHRDVRKPVPEQKRLQAQKAKVKDQQQKVEHLQENGADTHTIESRLVERQQLKTAVVNNAITTKHLGNERTSALWSGNRQDIFDPNNRNNVVQFNDTTGRMESRNVRGEVYVTTER